MVLVKELKYSVSGDVLFQEVGGETVLLDLGTERYFGLDEVGTRIWDLINEGRAVGELADVLLAEYDVDRATLERDIETLLSSLLEAGLISSDSPASYPDSE